MQGIKPSNHTENSVGVLKFLSGGGQVLVKPNKINLFCIIIIVVERGADLSLFVEIRLYIYSSRIVHYISMSDV